MFETFMKTIIDCLVILFGGSVIAVILTLFAGEAWTQW
jgi:hypothetical protein